MLKLIAHGALAGAAGTTALNAATYLDMAWRGRPASDTPDQMVDRLSDAADAPIPGDEETRGNRLTGLGSLSGIAVGVAVGMAAGAARAAGLRLSTVPGGVTLGILAMLATDLPMAATGVTDLRQWSPESWLSDLAPHLAYGLVTETTLRALDDSV
jgi:hypothetical protein